MTAYVIDIECNALENPSRIWIAVIKNTKSGGYSSYYDLTKKEEERERFNRDIKAISTNGDLLIGHNILGFDWPVLCTLLQMDYPAVPDFLLDTYVISTLVDYSKVGGHSIENYGKEFGDEKIKFTDFSKFTPEMEVYCRRDVDICERVYNKFRRYCSNPLHRSSIVHEHNFRAVTNSLRNSGFAFNVDKATNLLDKVTKELEELDKDILEAFPPRLHLIREITPKETKYGTLNKSDFRWVEDGNLSDYNGGPFCRCEWRSFNPSSHKQIITVLSDAGWMPVDKTQSHILAERDYRQLQRSKSDLSEITGRLRDFQLTGWKVNETNLDTLPSGAPKGARLLAKRILLESRRRTLTEWLGLVSSDGRIHGEFFGIGAWTHRMAHQRPNTANIPNEYGTDGKRKLLGKELRSLWHAPKKRLLVGCDAEGIQLRIFAHYINDPEFTEALVKGRKDDKTDPHSLNQRVLGSVCKSRSAAKRFIYALLLGAGIKKLSEILGCSDKETQEALDRLLEKYTGWKYLKEEVFPKDAKRGYFRGLDGRAVRIPGETPSSRQHLAMSGYLQNGEAVCMKLATMKWFHKLPEYDAKLVNFVHDEWQVECPNDMKIALDIARIMAYSLTEVSEDLKLNCPLAGSYWNDDKKDYTIGTNWSVTH